MIIYWRYEMITVLYQMDIASHGCNISSGLLTMKRGSVCKRNKSERVKINT